MSRPIIIDEPRKEIALALARAGMSGRWIAAYMGCDESTLRYALEKDESFRLRYMQGRAQMQMDQLANIARAAAKSWRASVWLLERLFPKEYNLRKSQNEPQLDELGFTVEEASGVGGQGSEQGSGVADQGSGVEAALDRSSFESDLLVQALPGHRLSPPDDPFPDAFHIPINIAPVLHSP